VDIGFHVAGNRGEFFVGGNLFLGAFSLAEDSLGGFLIAPEIGIGDARF
jgi:hypothetical protein